MLEQIWLGMFWGASIEIKKSKMTLTIVWGSRRYTFVDPFKKSLESLRMTLSFTQPVGFHQLMRFLVLRTSLKLDLFIMITATRIGGPCHTISSERHSKSVLWKLLPKNHQTSMQIADFRLKSYISVYISRTFHYISESSSHEGIWAWHRWHRNWASWWLAVDALELGRGKRGGVGSHKVLKHVMSSVVVYIWKLIYEIDLFVFLSNKRNHDNKVEHGSWLRV